MASYLIQFLAYKFTLFIITRNSSYIKSFNCFLVDSYPFGSNSARPNVLVICINHCIISLVRLWISRNKYFDRF